METPWELLKELFPLLCGIDGIQYSPINVTNVTVGSLVDAREANQKLIVLRNQQMEGLRRYLPSFGADLMAKILSGAGVNILRLCKDTTRSKDETRSKDGVEGVEGVEGVKGVDDAENECLISLVEISNRNDDYWKQLLITIVSRSAYTFREIVEKRATTLVEKIDWKNIIVSMSERKIENSLIFTCIPGDNLQLFRIILCLAHNSIALDGPICETVRHGCVSIFNYLSAVDGQLKYLRFYTETIFASAISCNSVPMLEAVLVSFLHWKITLPNVKPFWDKLSGEMILYLMTRKKLHVAIGMAGTVPRDILSQICAYPIAATLSKEETEIRKGKYDLLSLHIKQLSRVDHLEAVKRAGSTMYKEMIHHIMEVELGDKPVIDALFSSICRCHDMIGNDLDKMLIIHQYIQYVSCRCIMEEFLFISRRESSSNPVLRILLNYARDAQLSCEADRSLFKEVNQLIENNYKEEDLSDEGMW
jgi:hypothetical protein